MVRLLGCWCLLLVPLQSACTTGSTAGVTSGGQTNRMLDAPAPRVDHMPIAAGDRSGLVEDGTGKHTDEPPEPATTVVRKIAPAPGQVFCSEMYSSCTDDGTCTSAPFLLGCGERSPYPGAQHVLVECDCGAPIGPLD